jgi:hypothetical protein
MFQILIFIISIGARAIRAMCRHRSDLVLENLALQQQVTALKKERPDHRSKKWTEHSGWSFANRGLDGRAGWSS